MDKGLKEIQEKVSRGGGLKTKCNGDEIEIRAAIFKPQKDASGLSKQNSSPPAHLSGATYYNAIVPSA